MQNYNHKQDNKTTKEITKNSKYKKIGSTAEPEKKKKLMKKSRCCATLYDLAIQI